jgi:polysaccharide biosynthesis/export protein
MEANMKKRTAMGIGLLVAVSFLARAGVDAQAQGQAQPAAPTQAAPGPAQAAPGQTAAAHQTDAKAQPPADYRIGPEDVLDISVWNNPALTKTAPVRPDGKISLPLLNDITAAGLTPMQLRDVIAKKLVEYMPNPEVSVIVRDVNQFKVSVLGEVRKPGRFDFKSKATVLDAIALAGGLNDFAARSRILILRQDGTATKRIPVNYNKIISSTAEDDFYLQPGDVVVVP